MKVAKVENVGPFIVRVSYFLNGKPYAKCTGPGVYAQVEFFNLCSFWRDAARAGGFVLEYSAITK